MQHHSGSSSPASHAARATPDVHDAVEGLFTFMSLHSTRNDRGTHNTPQPIATQRVSSAFQYALSSAQFSKPAGRVLDVLTYILVPGLKLSDDDFDQRFLHASGAPQSGVCGVVWPAEELAYKCRTCERDPTCVICEDCFRNGDHSGHNYAIVRTSGGCCDCGDPQAWAPPGFCSRHRGPYGESDDPTVDLRQDFQCRLQQAVETVALFILSSAVALQQASASTLSNDAPADVVFKVKTLLRWLTLIAKGDAICRYIGNQLCQPNASWLRAVATRIVTAQQIDVSSDSSDSHSWLSLMMRMEGSARLPKTVHTETHALYFKLITDTVFKRNFFQIYVSNYERYIHAQVATLFRLKTTGRLTESEAQSDIIENFSVQLLTVPSLVPLMVCEGGMLDQVLAVLLNLLEMSSSPVRLYETGIPYQKTAFAAKYPFAQEESAALSTFTASNTHPVSPSRSRASPSTRRYSPGSESQAALDVLSAIDSATQSDDLGFQRNESTTDATLPIGESLSVRIMLQPDGRNRIHVERANGDRTELRAEIRAAAVGNPALQVGAPRDDNDDGDPDDFDDPNDEENDQMVDDEEDDAMIDDEAQSDDDHDPDVMVFDDDTQEHVILIDDDEVLPAIRDHLAPVVNLLFHLENVGRDGIEENDGNENRNNGGGNLPPNVNQEFTLTISPRFTSGMVLHQVKVFEEGLSFTPASRHRIVTDELQQNRFNTAVAAARKSIQEPHRGSGPLSHTMRLDWFGSDKLDVSALIFKVLGDLRYILSHESAAFHFLHVHKDAFRKFIRIVSVVQMTNPISRRFGDHDPVWTDVWPKLINLEMALCRIVESCVGPFCANDSGSYASASGIEFGEIDLKASRKQLVCLVRSCLDEWLLREQAFEALSTYAGEEFTVAHAQSVHIPLHRLLSLFVHYLIRVDRLDVRSALGLSNESTRIHYLRKLIQHPLRLQSFFAQVRAGMWRRNGRPAAGQMHMYHAPYSSEWFVELDIFLLQCGCLALGPELFISEAMRVFRIANLGEVVDLVHTRQDDGKNRHPSSSRRSQADESRRHGRMGEVADADRSYSEPRSDSTSVESSGNCGFLPLAPRHQAVIGNIIETLVVRDMGNSKSELAEYGRTIVEELLVLLVRICAERSRCGFSLKALLRSRFIHELAVKDKSYTSMTRAAMHRMYDTNESSVIMDQFEEKSTIEEVVDETLSEVAEHVRPRGMEQGFYRLKSSVWREFDPFNPHLNPRDRCSAEVHFASNCKKQNIRPQPIPLYRVCDQPVYEQFKDLHALALLACGNSPVSLATVILEKCLPRDGVSFSNGGFLDAALHLTCMTVESESSREQQDKLLYFARRISSKESFEYSSVGIVCEMTETIFRSFPDLEREYGAVLERILRSAVATTGNILKPLITAKVPQLFHTTESAGASSEEQTSQIREDLRKQRLSQRKKEQQAAAMASILRAQTNFAKMIGNEDDADLDETEEGMGMKDGCEEGHVDGNSVDIEVGAKWDFERQCVLCHSVQSPDRSGQKILGVIGFHQETRLPEIAARACEAGGNARQEGAHRNKNCASASHSRVATGEDSKSNNAKNDANSMGEPSGIFRGHPSECSIGEVGLLSSVGINVIESGIVAGSNEHISLCGHAVHVYCFEKYFKSLPRNRGHRGAFLGSDLVDLEKREFLCPVCRRFSNLILPLADSNLVKRALESVRCDAEREQRTGNDFKGWLVQRGEEIDRECEIRGVVSLQKGSKSGSGIRLRMSLGINSREVKEMMGSVVDLMKTFQVVGGAGNTTETERELATYEVLAQFANNVTSTMACVELGCRTVKWDDSLLGLAKKSIRTLFRATREYILLESGSRLRALRILWKLVTCRGYSGKRDGFVCACLLMLLWSRQLSWAEVKKVVRVGFGIVRMSLERDVDGRHKVLLKTAVYLRQAVMLSYAAGAVNENSNTEIHLRHYGSKFSVNEAREEVESLMEHFGIVGNEELWKQVQGVEESEILIPKKVGLIRLPHEIESLLEDAGHRSCQECGSVSGKKTRLCLVCGGVVCEVASKCGAGGIPVHMMQCSPVGVFMSLPHTCLEVVRGNRRAQLGSPYLDVHGEEDADMLRGKALFLCDERYSMVERLWVLHAFDQDSYILDNSVMTRFNRGGMNGTRTLMQAFEMDNGLGDDNDDDDEDEDE